MSKQFDDAFAAAIGSTNVQENIHATQIVAQSEVAQASAINIRNADLAALDMKNAVATKYADNVDTITFATAQANNAAAIDVADMAAKSIQAAKFGRDLLASESTAAIQTQAELSKLQANKPSPFTSPLRWVADSLHEQKLEGQLEEHGKAVQVASTHVNNLVTSAQVQMSEVLAMSNLTTSNAMRLRSAELNKGLAAQEIDANTAGAKVGVVRQAASDINALSKQAADWMAGEASRELERQRLQQSGDNLAFQRQLRKDALEKEQYQKLAIENAARFYRKSKGQQETSANIAASITAVTDMQKQEPAVFDAFNSAGATTVNTGGQKETMAAAVQTLSVNQIRALGGKFGDPELQNLGSEEIASRAAVYEARLLQSAYDALPAANKSKTGFKAWSMSLLPAQQNAYRAQATKLASDEVGSSGAARYAKDKTKGFKVGTAGLTLAGTSDPVALTSAYGISKEAAVVFAKPENRILLTAAAKEGGERSGTAKQVSTMLTLLRAAGVSNAEGQVAKITSKEAGAAIDKDPEVKRLLEHGVTVPVSANITFGGKSYDLSNPEDLYRLDQAVTGAYKPSSGALVSQAVGVLSPPSAVDIKAAKNLTKQPKDTGIFLGGTPEGEAAAALYRATLAKEMAKATLPSPTEAAQSASVYKPQGFEPAPIRPETEKLQAEQEANKMWLKADEFSSMFLP